MSSTDIFELYERTEKKESKTVKVLSIGICTQSTPCVHANVLVQIDGQMYGYSFTQQDLYILLDYTDQLDDNKYYSHVKCASPGKRIYIGKYPYKHPTDLINEIVKTGNNLLLSDDRKRKLYDNKRKLDLISSEKQTSSKKQKPMDNLFSVLIYGKMKYTRDERSYIDSDGDVDHWFEKTPSVETILLTFTNESDMDEQTAELPKGTYNIFSHKVGLASEPTTRKFTIFTTRE